MLWPIDFDNENAVTQDDWRFYLHFLYRTVPKIRGQGKLVSVALHSIHLLPEEIYPLIDRIHLMAYDMRNGAYHSDIQLVKQAIDKHRIEKLKIAPMNFL